MTHGTQRSRAVGIRPARWDALRRSMRGDLLRPGDAGYQQARLTYWAQFDAVTPQAVAVCGSAEDVAACLKFCQDHDLPAVARSGGHSLGGYSTSDGLVIDVSRLAQVQVRRAVPTAAPTVVVGAGVRQVDALLALGRGGLAIPSGMCPTVGVGGFVSGGGFGWTTRRDGMASDQLVSAEVVLADGRVVRCSQTQEPELLWALHYCVDRSRLIKQEIPSAGIQEMLAVFDGDRRAGQVRLLSFFALGGQVNRVPRGATAYVHRTAQYYLAYWVGLDRDQPDGQDRAAAQAWADEGFCVIDRYSGGESYQNFIDPRLERWQQAYYAENYPRLVAAKRRYDPHGFSRFAQAIG